MAHQLTVDDVAAEEELAMPQDQNRGLPAGS